MTGLEPVTCCLRKGVRQVQGAILNLREHSKSDENVPDCVPHCVPHWKRIALALIMVLAALGFVAGVQGGSLPQAIIFGLLICGGYSIR